MSLKLASQHAINPIFIKRCGPTSRFRLLYLQLSSQCHHLICHQFYHTFIAGTILLCVISSYMETLRIDHKAIETMNVFILYVFLCDVVLVMTAEPYPVAYFYDSWNVFDFFIVVSSFIPGAGSLLFLLRILRVFRVMKIFKRLPRLQIIIESLMSSRNSIVLVSTLLFIWITLMALVGMVLFRKNDPTLAIRCSYQRIALRPGAARGR